MLVAVLFAVIWGTVVVRSSAGYGRSKRAASAGVDHVYQVVGVSRPEAFDEPVLQIPAVWRARLLTFQPCVLHLGVSSGAIVAKGQHVPVAGFNSDAWTTSPFSYLGDLGVSVLKRPGRDTLARRYHFVVNVDDRFLLPPEWSN